MQLRIEENPAGYSAGTYGYVITYEDGLGRECMTCDGGYTSRELAESAGRKMERELRATGAIVLTVPGWHADDDELV